MSSEIESKISGVLVKNVVKISNQYMQNELLDIKVDIGLGTKKFTAYTMDLTKKYIEINADYRS